MKTRTAHLCAITMSLAFFLAAPAAMADPVGKKEVHINEKNFVKLSKSDQERVLDLQVRIADVLAVDKESLSKEERAELRKEWKALKGEMDQYNQSGNVIYISTVGILLIILILVLVL